MPISVTCPECGTVFGNVPDHFAGKQARCKNCQTGFQVEPTVIETDAARPESKTIRETENGAKDGQPVEWSIGDVILNRYEVISVLGEGGMGTVYKVRHRDWDMYLAVKCPKPSILQRAGGAENFEREAETWVNMGLHPHTVSCYYVRRIGGIPRVFAEFVEGGSLADWVQDKRLYAGGHKKALARILDIAIQFAWGLDYSHELGLIHQDVKPANVMMTPEGLVKVTDFGLARARPMSDAEGADAQGTMIVNKVGMTPAYASPEQASGKPLTRRTDLWSWGVSLLEMFTGEVIWPIGTVVLGILDSFLAEGPEDDRIPPMPPEVADLLRDCFQENPDDRPHNMNEAAERLIPHYEKCCGESYTRNKPSAGRESADSLNNRAVSFLDLGKRKEAEKMWRQALGVDSHHVETNYNVALYEWNHRAVTDDQVWRRLREVAGTHKNDLRYEQLMGRMHLFFGQYGEAYQQFARIVQQGQPGVEDLKDLLMARSAMLWDSGRIEEWNDLEQTALRVRDMGYQDPVTVSLTGLSLLGQDRVLEAREYYAGKKKEFPDLPGSLEEAIKKYVPGREVGATAQQKKCSRFSMVLVPKGMIVASPERVSRWDITPGELRLVSQKEITLPKPRFFMLNDHGTRLFSVGVDGKLYLYNASSGEPMVRIPTLLSGQIKCGAINHDASLALTGTHLGAFSLWDINKRESMRQWEAHEGPVSCLAFHPGGRYILSAGNDLFVRMWDVDSEKPVRVFQGHDAPITWIGFGSNGKLAVTASEDHTIGVWDLTQGKSLKNLVGHTDQVTKALVGPDGSRLVSISKDHSLRIWNLSSIRPREIIRFEHGIEDLALLPGGEAAVLALSEPLTKNIKNLALFDLDGRERYKAPYAVTMPMSAAEVDALEAEYRAKYSEVRKMLKEESFKEAFGLIREMRSIPGHERDPKVLDLWDGLLSKFPKTNLAAMWKEHTSAVHEEEAWGLVVTPDGSTAVSGGKDNLVSVWDARTMEIKHRLEGHQNAVTSIALDGPGRLAVSGSHDFTAILWDVQKGEAGRTLRGHDGPILAVSMSADGRFVLTGSEDRTLGLWETRTGKRLLTLEGHKEAVTAVALSEDGRFCVSGSQDKYVRLWDLTRGQCLQILEGHALGVTGAALSPDGQHALSVGQDQTLRIWNLKKGEMEASLRGHEGPITSLYISRDGRYALTGSDDRTIRLWSLNKRSCVQVFEMAEYGITAACLTPDGRMALAACRDGTVTNWHLDWELVSGEDIKWDEGARPYLLNFLSLMTPLSEQPPERKGKAAWTEADVDTFVEQLGLAGLGRVQRSGVLEELEQTGRVWNGPPEVNTMFPNTIPTGMEIGGQVFKRLLGYPLVHWKITAAVVVVLLGLGYFLMAPRTHTGPRGFRDVKFGTLLNDHPDMKGVPRSMSMTGSRLYSRSDDGLHFQGAELKAIHYKFEKEGELTEIILYPKSVKDSDRILSYYVEKYGEGEESIGRRGETVTRWSWGYGKVVLTHRNSIIRYSSGI